MAEPNPIAALAAQIEDLRGQLARAQGEAAHLRARLEEASGQDMMMRLEVKHLSEQVKDLAARLGEAVAKHRIAGPPAPYWRGQARDEYAAQLAGLRDWVERFLRVHYPGYTARLPACWAAHGEAIWELSTLMTEWNHIYGAEKNRDLDGALVWHDRYLPGVISRLAASIRCDQAGCRMTRPPPRSW